MTRAELAAKVFELLNGDNLAALEQLTDAGMIDPQIEIRSVIATAEGRVYVGIDGIHEWSDAVHSTFGGLHLEIEEFHEAGDRAVLVVRVTGVGKASGVPVEQLLGQVWTWRDGMLWCNEVYLDPYEAFAAVGLQRGEVRG